MLSPCQSQILVPGTFPFLTCYRTQEAYVASDGWAWLDVGPFFWGHHRSMLALLGNLRPDSVRTLGMSSSEDPVWKNPKVGGLTGTSQVKTRWSLVAVSEMVEVRGQGFRA